MHIELIAGDSRIFLQCMSSPGDIICKWMDCGDVTNSRSGRNSGTKLGCFLFMGNDLQAKLRE